MKAVQYKAFGGPDVLEVVEIEKPTINDHEVLVEVQFAGVNYADIMQRSGNYPGETHFPATLGSEVVGKILACGSAVKHLSIGTSVVAMSMTHGGYAEYIALPADQVIPIPDGVDLEKASGALVQGLTAYGLIHHIVDIQEGQTVLIPSAAGGVGSLAVQMAKQVGARVIGLAGSDEKLNTARALGADIAINYRNDDWDRAVMDATNGNGVFIGYEMIGGDVGRKTLDVIGFGGYMVIFGIASGQPTHLTTMDIIMKQITLRAYGMNAAPDYIVETVPQLLQWIAKGNLEVKTQVYPLLEVAQAHQDIAQRQTQGKVVLKN